MASATRAECSDSSTQLHFGESKPRTPCASSRAARQPELLLPRAETVLTEAVSAETVSAETVLTE